MRCNNPECLRTVKNPSDKMKETRLCGNCRKKIIKENKLKPITMKLKPKGRRKATKTAMEKFEESLKTNPEYHKFINMFRTMEKPNVRTL